MKKILTISISMILTMILLVGCGSANTASNNTATNDAAIETAENTESSMQDEVSTSEAGITESSINALVVYFTRAENIGGTPDVDATSSASININGSDATGNLKIMADYITEYTGADEFSILTVDAYPQGYRDTTNQAKTEQNDNYRPSLSTHVENMDQYDYVFIGYPNWWGGLPMPVYTFLEEYNFTGKTIIPFASHEGSGLGNGPSEIADTCPDATVLDGIAVRGSAVSGSQSDIEKWIDGLSLDVQK
ncbi:flavodoxin [Eisenbergiella sp.]